MSTNPPAPQKPAQGPSIRLNLSSSSTNGAVKPTTPPPAPTPNNKRKRYTPVALPPYTASAADCTVLHQKTSLQFVLHQNVGQYDTVGPWFGQAQTCLYLTVDPVPRNQPAGHLLSLALHLRGSCRVSTVQVECLGPSNLGLQSLRTSYHHGDPLEHVLLKPPTSYTEQDIAAAVADANDDDNNKPNYKFDADSQSSRGAAGMTTSLRAASIASNMGELRLSVDMPPTVTIGTTPGALDPVRKAWLDELLRETSTEGTTVTTLREQLHKRAGARRLTRLNLVADRLASATGFEQAGNRALKVTVRYTIPLLSQQPIVHLAGLHALTVDQNPVIYTTAGVVGDHEGPRAWLPCLDSASCKHRATHEIVIKVTAPLRQGISCLGFGQDFGCSQALLHDSGNDLVRSLLSSSNGAVATGFTVGELARRLLGDDQLDLLQSIGARAADSGTTTHVIPTEEQYSTTAAATTTTSIDAVQVTSIWCSHTWTPMPARSLGFAIGPFKVLEDPEYFGPTALLETASYDDGDDDDDNEGPDLAERLEAFLENARTQGEGIRQAYFAPVFERKFIHENASTMLMPNTDIQLSPLTVLQKEQAELMDQTVLYSTMGVPHRALSLMRDVLALPTYRTSSYTQIWIPNAVHGGSSSGSLHSCPEVLVNPFLGGAIMDSRLLPPVRSRLPFHQGGRVLQFLQARSAIRGWITAALPLGGRDDVGMGYILSLIESFVMSLYERGHGAQGEGGAKGSIFFSQRYSYNSGLNSQNLDFLPVQNVEDLDVVIEGVGAVPVEDRHNEQLWRSANNGTESHTSGMDEFSIRQLLVRDAIEALERDTDKDRLVPTPSMGWFGSHLSLSFLSSNASSSSDLGCGAVDMMHPVGGLVYRCLKSEVLRAVVEGRAGVASFLRLVRATFIASHLDDIGATELKLPTPRDKKQHDQAPSASSKDTPALNEPSAVSHQPPFVVCVNEILKKKGLTHTLFTRALRNLSGKVKEPHLLGTLVDVERSAEDPRSSRPFVEPEGFPNSYVRGASMLYCRVGVQVEATGDNAAAKDQGSVVLAQGIVMQAYAEPIIPEGGIAYGGPITIRVVENEGQFREFVKELSTDGSRRDWGGTFLHAKAVTTAKAQTAASGKLEGSKDSSKAGAVTASVFADGEFHAGGYQAIELIRLTNLTPLLWVRVDPMGLYGGRISVFLPDACLAEQLFHDGDAGAQVDAIRSLAERPLRIQGSVKATTIYDVDVSELPVRVLGDCLRGSPALHSSLPHTPAVRVQAALAVAQWQNNKAPATKDTVGPDSWVGLNLLLQYFRERFSSSSVIMPVKFSRLVLKQKNVAAVPSEDAGATPKPKYDDAYQYLDVLEEGEERASALEEAEEVEIEEDEEYRVRSAVVTAIASIRAKDGLTPSSVVGFLETLLESEDAEMVGHLVYPEEELTAEKTFEKMKTEENDEQTSASADTEGPTNGCPPPSLSYVSSMLVADALLALCHINARPAVITDPATGQEVQTSGVHPLTRIIKAARGWLDWELYRERIRSELGSQTASVISGNCHDSISPCAIIALANLAILKQSTISSPAAGDTEKSEDDSTSDIVSVRFYIDIFDSKPIRNDLTRAACAQAVACICCASDRLEKEGTAAVGLLYSLEFLLDRIIDATTSPSLRHTLSLIMMDACTGKVCSMQRVGAIAGRNELVSCAPRYLNGPLGACHGGDNGSALLVAVSSGTFPSANAVNDGARRGLRLLMRAGHPRETEAIGEVLVVRVAHFATRLWRTINGEPADPLRVAPGTPVVGVCAYDCVLRASLLALWQWIWPRGCYAVLQVQAWKSHVGTQRYKDLGAYRVMKISDDEKAASAAEENALSDLNGLVNVELDRQAWRGEMVKKAFELSKSNKGGPAVQDVAAVEQGIGQPLPPIQRDAAFKQGGWIASAAQQRRTLALDGGTAVTKLRLKVKTAADS